MTVSDHFIPKTFCAGSSYTYTLIQNFVRTHCFLRSSPIFFTKCQNDFGKQELGLDCTENNLISDFLKHSQSQQQNEWVEGLDEIRLSSYDAMPDGNAM